MTLKKLPSDVQFQQAIQHPRLCFLDPELKSSVVEENRMGLPIVWAGNFAFTFKLTQPNGQVWAVRCFHRYAPDRYERYELISDHLDSIKSHLLKNPLSRFVLPIDYLDNEMLVEGSRYPITKMPWIDGSTLGDFINENHYSRASLIGLAEELNKMCGVLQKEEIAHGDLSHDNILVHRNGLVLVDYDGLYIPRLRGRASLELGHENFQHPRRSSTDFGAHLDRFSSIVIYLALQALIEKPDLWTRYGPTSGKDSGAEGILFQKKDFQHPTTSALLNELDTIPALHKSVSVFRRICVSSLADVPPLDKFISDTFPKSKASPSTGKATKSESDSASKSDSPPRSETTVTAVPVEHYTLEPHPERKNTTNNHSRFVRKIAQFATILTILAITYLMARWIWSNFHPTPIVVVPTVETLVLSVLTPTQFPDSPTSENQDPFAVIAQVSSSTIKLNVRSGPGMNYPPVTQIDGGTRLEIKAKSGAWLRVIYDDKGNIGWVAANFTEILAGSLDTIPIIDSAQSNATEGSQTSDINGVKPTLRALTVLDADAIATFTPVATPTPKQLSIATKTSVPTELPTSTDVPTVAPAPTAVLLGANCSSTPEAAFISIWQQYRNLIGCPASGTDVIPILAEEIFQGGHMFWRSDLDEVYIVYDHSKEGGNLFEGNWQTNPSWKWDNSNPDGIGLTPPPGLYEPVRGFGWVWRTFLGREDGRLGWALDHEYGFNNLGLAQKFEKGLIFRGSDPKTYLFLYDGNFFAR